MSWETKPTQTILPTYVSESANTDRQKSHNTCKHILLCSRLMLQAETCFITGAGPWLPAGENHWASASNSSPAAASFSTSSSDEVYGRQQAHRTHIKPKTEPQLSGPGPPKQWCNTQMAYVTNLGWQFLTLKQTRWRPWEHSPQNRTGIQSVHICLHLHKHTATQWMDPI